MEEPYLPWWLVLLLGLWATALTLWQHSRVNREVRLWAGASTVVYLLLIFFALGFGSHSSGTAASFFAKLRFEHVGIAVCICVGLVSAIGMVGRITARSRQVGYVLFSLANSAFCVLVRAPEIAVALFVIAGLSAWPLLREWSQTRTQSPRSLFADFLKFTEEPNATTNAGESWLIGAMNGILACVLIGTLAYSLRFETSRPIASPRFTALPSRESLNRAHSSGNRPNKDLPLFDLAFGPRADIVVLLAAIIFLCLAIAVNDSPPSKPVIAGPSINPQSDNSFESKTGSPCPSSDPLEANLKFPDRTKPDAEGSS